MTDDTSTETTETAPAATETAPAEAQTDTATEVDAALPAAEDFTAEETALIADFHSKVDESAADDAEAFHDLVKWFALEIKKLRA